MDASRSNTTGENEPKRAFLSPFKTTTSRMVKRVFALALVIFCGRNLLELTKLDTSFAERTPTSDSPQRWYPSSIGSSTNGQVAAVNLTQQHFDTESDTKLGMTQRTGFRPHALESASPKQVERLFSVARPLEELRSNWKERHEAYYSHSGDMDPKIVARYQTGYFSLGLGRKYQLCIVFALALGLTLEVQARKQARLARYAPIPVQRDETTLTRTIDNDDSENNQSKHGYFPWRDPVISFKLFVSSLLFFTINLHTPEQLVLSGIPDTYDKYAPDFVYYLLPGLVQDEGDYESPEYEASHYQWHLRLVAARNCLITCWLLYLILPVTSPSSKQSARKFCCFFGASCYVVGALLFSYFYVLYLAFYHSHRTQSPAIFVLVSVLVVPFLGGNNNAGSCVWLKRFLYVSILIPTYLSPGFSKFRYKGLASNLSGSWVGHLFKHVKLFDRKTTFPSINNYIKGNPWTWPFFSWGNIFIELILPLLTLLTLDDIYVGNDDRSGGDIGVWVRLSFHVVCVVFHFTIYLLMGPTFPDYICMHVLAADPLMYVVQWWQQSKGHINGNHSKLHYLLHYLSHQSCCGGSATNAKRLVLMDDRVVVFDESMAAARKRQACNERLTHCGWLLMRWLKQGMSWYTVCGFFWVHFKSDIWHLRGKVKFTERMDPLFPFSEYPMFANPKKDATSSYFLSSLALVGLAFLCYAWFLRKRHWRW